jgi:hypothetical protein
MKKDKKQNETLTVSLKQGQRQTWDKLKALRDDMIDESRKAKASINNKKNKRKRKRYYGKQRQEKTQEKNKKT